MTQEQQQLQRAAFIMAEYDHKNDEGIKEQAAKVQTLRESIQAKDAEIAKLRQDLGIEGMTLRRLLLPFIPKELIG